jgi:membrane peptidoglycan carboxypeptidase
LANSLNASAVNLAADVGVDTIHALGSKMGLNLGDDPWRFGLSLALGGAEVGLLDLTSGLGALGNGGRHVPHTTILSIERISDGRTLFSASGQGTQVVSAQTAWLISDILDDDGARTEAFGANNPLAASRPIAVKTGTTNDFRDNLTVGWTPWLAVGVWTGNKDGRPMRNVLGITGAAPIWRETVETVFADERLMRLLGDGQAPRHGFAVPAGITRAQVCHLPTLVSNGACRLRDESFAAGGATRDEQMTFGYFASASGCATRVANSTLGRLALLAPEHPRVASEVRGWWRGSPPVAAPPCSASAGGHSPARILAPIAAAASRSAP